MWEQYKKRFVGMQAVIIVATALMFVMFGRQWVPAVRFFVVMQVASIVGAQWGYRLKRRMQGRA